MSAGDGSDEIELLDTVSERRLAWLLAEARALAREAKRRGRRRELDVTIVADERGVISQQSTVTGAKHPPD